MQSYLLIAMLLTAFCMVANRLSRTVLTAPMLFLASGAVFAILGMVPEAGTEEALHIVAEVALIVLLFLDAAQIDQMAIRKRHVWPVRMLLIGLPLMFVFGLLAGLAILPGMSLAMLALIAAILMPTDAALGQPVLANKDVPERTRRALTIESGLNDGFALPVVLMMAAFAATDGMAPDQGWFAFTLAQLTLGPLAGLIIGCLGGVVLIWAKDNHATAEVYEGIGALALAATAYLAAISIGGNGFIAAFVAGLGFGAMVKGRCAFVYEFTESEGQLLSWTAFFLLGATLVPEAIGHLTIEMALLILVSLIILRPAAIWLSLMGTDAPPKTRIFFGWFGPRGLATALFALLVAEQLEHEAAEMLVSIAINAVWISAVLHGITAAPWAAWYANSFQTDTQLQQGSKS